MKKHTLKHLALFAAIAAISATAQADVGKTAAYAEAVAAESVVKNSFGECWHTGTWTKEQAVVEGCDGYVKPVPAPAPVAAKPAPAPMPAPAPAPAAKPMPAPKKFSLKADVLFKHDKSDLQPQGKQDLDALYSEIQQTNPERKTIKVIGYADRTGSAKYNQKLSESRAQTVAKYLTAKGIAGDVIEAEGRGENDPVTGNTCDKVAPRAKLISCLEPDRRVELEVTGMVAGK